LIKRRLDANQLGTLGEFNKPLLVPDEKDLRTVISRLSRVEANRLRVVEAYQQVAFAEAADELP